MALKYEINMFETDPNDASKTFVTLLVKDDAGHSFAISKSVFKINVIIIFLFK
jgi:hypothetical protein